MGEARAGAKLSAKTFVLMLVARLLEEGEYKGEGEGEGEGSFALEVAAGVLKKLEVVAAGAATWLFAVWLLAVVV